MHDRTPSTISSSPGSFTPSEHEDLTCCNGVERNIPVTCYTAWWTVLLKPGLPAHQCCCSSQLAWSYLQLAKCGTAHMTPAVHCVRYCAQNSQATGCCTRVHCRCHLSPIFLHQRLMVLQAVLLLRRASDAHVRGMQQAAPRLTPLMDGSQVHTRPLLMFTR
jgi:hypothetical protein